jgi:hypothetical protein
MSVECDKYIETINSNLKNFISFYDEIKLIIISNSDNAYTIIITILKQFYSIQLISI